MRSFAQKQNQPQEQRSPSLARSSAATSRSIDHAHPILRLQRTLGNQAVQRLLRANSEDVKGYASSTPDIARPGNDFRTPVNPASPVRLQAKLTVNRPGDVYEQEADRTADKVLRMPEPQPQRAWGCAGERPQRQAERQSQAREHVQIQRVQASDTGETSVPPIVHEVLRSPGQPLDPATRAFMAPRFGRDFSQVRIHADAKAAESARAVNASAYTVGQDVVFGAGQYAPGTSAGQRLLAHELTHVVQQGEACPQCQPQRPGHGDEGLRITRAGAGAGLVQRNGPAGVARPSQQHTWTPGAERLATPTRPPPGASRLDRWPYLSTVEVGPEMQRREEALNENAAACRRVIDRMAPLTSPFLVASLSDEQLRGFWDIAQLLLDQPAASRLGFVHDARFFTIRNNLAAQMDSRPALRAEQQAEFASALRARLAQQQGPSVGVQRAPGRTLSSREIQVALAGGPMPGEQRIHLGVVSTMVMWYGLLHGRTPAEAVQLSQDPFVQALDGAVEGVATMRARMPVPPPAARAGVTEAAPPRPRSPVPPGGSGAVRRPVDESTIPPERQIVPYRPPAGGPVDPERATPPRPVTVRAYVPAAGVAAPAPAQLPPPRGAAHTPPQLPAPRAAAPVFRPGGAANDVGGPPQLPAPRAAAPVFRPSGAANDVVGPPPPVVRQVVNAPRRRPDEDAPRRPALAVVPTGEGAAVRPRASGDRPPGGGGPGPVPSAPAGGTTGALQPAGSEPLGPAARSVRFERGRVVEVPAASDSPPSGTQLQVQEGVRGTRISLVRAREWERAQQGRTPFIYVFHATNPDTGRPAILKVGVGGQSRPRLPDYVHLLGHPDVSRINWTVEIIVIEPEPVPRVPGQTLRGRTRGERGVWAGREYAESELEIRLQDAGLSLPWSHQLRGEGEEGPGFPQATGYRPDAWRLEGLVWRSVEIPPGVAAPPTTPYERFVAALGGREAAWRRLERVVAPRPQPGATGRGAARGRGRLVETIPEFQREMQRANLAWPGDEISPNALNSWLRRLRIWARSEGLRLEE